MLLARSFMLRKVFTICVWLGLLASLGLWLASYVNVGLRTPSRAVLLEQGSVLFTQMPADPTADAPPTSDSAEQSAWTVEGFRGLQTAWLPRISTTAVGRETLIPLWMPTLLFAVLALKPVNNVAYDLLLSEKRLVRRSVVKTIVVLISVLGMWVILGFWLLQPLSIGIAVTRGELAQPLQVPNSLDGSSSPSIPTTMPSAALGKTHALQAARGRLALFTLASGDESGLDVAVTVPQTQQVFSISMGTLMVLCLAVFAYFFLLPSALRFRRQKKGLCIACGHDLKGSAWRCPQCYTPFQK